LKTKVVPTFRSPDSLSGFELALAMRAKLSTPEGKAVYAKRFQISEGVFGAVKGLRAGHRFLRRRLERVQEEWAERCIAAQPCQVHRLAGPGRSTFKRIT
jgi:hypothetical protein